MRRQNPPEFSISEGDELDDAAAVQERARRLAFLLETMRDNPVEYGKVIDRYDYVHDVLAASKQPEVQEFARRPDAHQEFTFNVRALFATAQVLHHRDDIFADTDRETIDAVTAKLQTKTRTNPDIDRRLLRLSTIAEELSHTVTPAPSLYGKDRETGSFESGSFESGSFDAPDAIITVTSEEQPAA